jgi:poly(glycerol-phosphate) alpha-glucosyltransferase
MIRVAHVTASLSRLGGGVSEVVWALATHQTGCGASSGVYGLRDAYTPDDVRPGAAVRCYAGRVLGPRALGYSPDLQRHLRSQAGAVDVVHAHGLWAHPSREARRFADRARVPRMVSVHGMLEPWCLDRSRWKKRVVSWLYERRNLTSAACLHALCRAEANSVRAVGLTNPIAVIPNGVDLAIYESPPDGRDVRRRWPSLPDKRLVLFLGRIHPKKGLLHLAEAWSRLGSRSSGWHLVIAGPDVNGHRAEIEQDIARRRIPDQVTFTGPVQGDRKLALLAAADLFVLPSFSEGFSVAVLEALACRLPVLISPQCNFEEVVAAGAGIQAEPDADAVAEGLSRMLGLTDKERQEMGARGHDLVARHYVWPCVARQTLDTYRWLRGDGPRPEFVDVIE